MIRANDWTEDMPSEAEGLVSVQQRTLGWTDPETGQRLTVRLRGSARFLQALEPLGFEQLEALDSERSCTDRVAAELLEDEDRDAGESGGRAWVSLKCDLSSEDEQR